MPAYVGGLGRGPEVVPPPDGGGGWGDGDGDDADLITVTCLAAEFPARSNAVAVSVLEPTFKPTVTCQRPPEKAAPCPFTETEPMPEVESPADTATSIAFALVEMPSAGEDMLIDGSIVSLDTL